MRVELVVVGVSENAHAEWTTLARQSGVPIRFYPDVEAACQNRSDAVEVLMLTFRNGVHYREALTAWKAAGRITASIACLQQPDFMLCREAFRSGANDVIAAPISLIDFQASIESLKREFAMRVHPDAVLPLDVVERDAIKLALLACNGQVSKTSRKLGIGRSTLYRKLELYDLMTRA